MSVYIRLVYQVYLIKLNPKATNGCSIFPNWNINIEKLYLYIFTDSGFH